MKGKLIVIEGGDGSGKSTQFAMLRDRLEHEKYNLFTTKFPRHGHPSAYFVGRMLRGEYGTLEEQNPYRTSLFYTLDRFDASEEIKQHMDRGDIVLLDRYTSANIGHQGSKIEDTEERKKYIEWLDTMEYTICDIPRPDIVFYLHMPVHFAVDLIAKRTDQEKDIHEGNMEYLYKTEQAFLEASSLLPNWQIIECVKNDQLRSIGDIHEELYKKVLNTMG